MQVATGELSGFKIEIRRHYAEVVHNLLRLGGDGFFAEQPAARPRMLPGRAENGVITDRHGCDRANATAVCGNKADTRAAPLGRGEVGDIDTAQHNAPGLDGPQVEQGVGQF